MRVGVLTYTLPAPGGLPRLGGGGKAKQGTLYYRDQDKMLADFARMRAQADVVIVSMHWGYEYTHGVNAEQKKLGPPAGGQRSRPGAGPSSPRSPGH